MDRLWPALFAAIVGLCAGSFLNTCIHRVPRGLSLIRPRSHCGCCGHVLGVWELIPIWSYFRQGGRCLHCAAPIEGSHPWVEGGTAILAVLFVLAEGFSPGFWRVFVLSCVFVCVAVVDARHRIIPDGFVAAGLGFAFFQAAFLGRPPWQEAGLGLVVAGGSFALLRTAYRKLRGKEGMGAGDVKLAALMGATLGTWGWVLATLLASIAGSLMGMALILTHKAFWGTPLPFGAFLAVSSILVLFVFRIFPY